MEPKTIVVTYAVQGDSYVFVFQCTTPAGHTFTISRGEPVADASNMTLQQMCDSAYAAVHSAIQQRVVELDNIWGQKGVVYVPPSGKTPSSVTPVAFS